MPKKIDASAVARLYVKIPLFFFVLSAAYIVLSSGLLSSPLGYTYTILLVEISKGIGFIAVTAVLLWYFLYREHRARLSTETTFRTLVENMTDAVFLLRLPGREIVYANPAVREMFGYREDELIGASTRMLHASGEDFRVFHDTGNPGLDAGNAFRGELKLRRKNGEVFPAEHAVSTFANAQRERFAVSIVTDVSRQKEAEDRLRETETRFRQIAENIREVFWVTDPGTTVMEYISPAYEEIWGRPIAEIYADPTAFIDAVHPADRDMIARALEKKAEGGYDVQYRIVRPDGGVRWIWDRGAPVRDATGRIYRIVGIAEDVTRLKDQEAELSRTQKMEALGQLTGGIAHDFNNMLSVIQGSAELLKDDLQGDPAAAESLNRILQASGDAAELTRRLLTFSRERALRPDIVDPNTMIGNVVGLLGRTLGEQIAIRTELASGIWPVSVDRPLLENCLVNLGINARDAMPGGGTLVFRTANRALTAAPAVPGDYVMLAVTDSGAGMSPEVAARVFEPFFTTKTQDKGTGLGLSMVHGFVTQSGGFVDLRTAPGAGTTFRLYLPRHAGVAAAADAAPDAGAVPVGNETVLVVEDQAMVRALFVTMLGRIGYTVLEAGGGAGALELLDRRAAEIGLMVTDVVMPGMSGPELALETRRRHPGMKVLFASGHGETAALAKAGWTETADVLRKPFQLAELATAVRRAIDAGDRS